ncbi:Hypothetical protein CAP_7466 [Chondromyces apiculatus DSM 436]|uniref:Uncharacterized protein n=1 Tax=Chondromyces apiculatus DSM 436 TaxID=1192034 RepID=A0A017T0Q7_9BACT|nr:Hypothetical protein CAP_7466 [Chondromyces apiculatus DSM 436]
MRSPGGAVKRTAETCCVHVRGWLVLDPTTGGSREQSVHT